MKWMKSEKGLTLIGDSEVHVVLLDHPRFAEICKALDENWEESAVCALLNAEIMAARDRLLKGDE